MIITLLITFIVGVIGFCVYLIYQRQADKAERTSAEAIESRLAFLQEGLPHQGMGDARQAESNFMDNLGRDLMNVLGQFFPAASEKRMSALNKAGYRGPNAFNTFTTIQLGSSITLFSVFLLVGMVGEKPLIGLLLAFLGAFLGFYTQESKLRKMREYRARCIQKTIPDLIDILSNCVLAGLSFDLAVDYVINELPPRETMKPLIEDMLLWRSDVNFGMERDEAWKRLTERSDSRNMRYFVSLIDQSEKTGGSISEALFKMADFFRERRKQELEAEIAALPGKMVILTILHIALPLCLMLLAPIGLYFVQTMKSAV